MNPLDWRGPEFLLFYLCFGGAVLGLQWFLQRQSESGDEVPQGLVDPYAIAYLRKGAKAVGQVGILSLIDRDLLKASDSSVLPAEGVSPLSADHPIEQTILASVSPSLTAHELSQSSAVEAACFDQAGALQHAGLLPDAPARSRRWQLCALAIVCLGAVSAVKIVLALERGHSNILFLLLLTILFAGLSVLIANRHRTALGDRTLESLRGLCSDLCRRAPSMSSGTQTRELMLLVAVFGLDVVPVRVFPMASAFFGPPPSQDSGSSCGGGDSGGSGCGGGGCGGGGCGGGCGGCGS